MDLPQIVEFQKKISSLKIEKEEDIQDLNSSLLDLVNTYFKKTSCKERQLIIACSSDGPNECHFYYDSRRTTNINEIEDIIFFSNEARIEKCDIIKFNKRILTTVLTGIHDHVKLTYRSGRAYEFIDKMSIVEWNDRVILSVTDAQAILVLPQNIVEQIQNSWL